MSHLDSLAGLDSMVLHINSHSNPSPTLSHTTATLDGDSYVFVPPKKRKLERARRTPLADRTPSFNINGSHGLSSVIPRKPDTSIYQDSAKTHPSPVASRPPSRLPSFRPLPPMPESSPLRTSFLDFSLHSSTPLPEAYSEAKLSAAPSSVSPKRSCVNLTRDQSKCVNAASLEIHDEPFLIPAFQHPNSPYVPWAPPIRRRILKPFMSGSRGSVLSSGHSRPVSRSGARAPEPAETPEPPQRLNPAPKGWKQFRQTISYSFHRVTAHFGALKPPFTSKKIISSCTPPLDAMQTHSISHEDTFFIANYSPSSISPLAVLSGPRIFTPSIASLASSDSTTLAAWLAARQRVSLDVRDYDPGSLMTLEEYERVGSWLDLSGDGRVDGKWVCGVPGCEVHARHMLMHSGQVTTLDVPAGKENSISVLRRNPPSPRHRSSPQFRDRVSSMRGMHIMHGDGSLLSSSLSDRREREMCMPGGWTF